MRSFATALRPAALLWVALAMIPIAAAADDADYNSGPGQAQDQDPPDRVARLSLTQGAVSLQPAGVQEWATADVNRPLTTGDKVWTDQDSRAELDVGSAAVRLGSTTGFSFLNLDDHTTQMQVTAGTLIVRVRSVNAGDNFEVDTPNLAVSLLRPGQYRFEVNDAGDTTVVEVSEGDAEAAGDGQGYPIHAQQKATFIGTQQLSSVVGTLGAPDELDSWSLSRDRQVQSAQSQQYVSPEATGYADLDDNGRWEDTPDYGYVWTPTTVAVGWAPYQFGHWLWINPWGWTWVDDAPWGFAPFHYGRWVNFRDSWCWVPGPRRVRPVYAPALVAWVGGPRVGVSVAFGAGVGWFPLGPREVYVPSYRVSPGYVQRVNISNTTIVNRTYITNVYENRATNVTYVNRNVRGAVTTVPQNVFTSAQPVGRNRMRMSEGDLKNFAARGAAPSIAPVRQSLIGADARVNARQPPPTFQNRPIVVRTPPPHAPVSFDRQSEAIRANGGRPLGRAELSRLQPSAPAAQVRVVTPRQSGFRPGGGTIGPGNGVQSRGLPNATPEQRGVPQPPTNGNEPSMADRERAIREGRQQQGNADNRGPVGPRQGMRQDRPPSAPQPPPGATDQPNGSRPIGVPAREYRTQRDDNQPRGPSRNEVQPTQPRNETQPAAQPQVNQPQVNQPQVNEGQSRVYHPPQGQMREPSTNDRPLQSRPVEPPNRTIERPAERPVERPTERPVMRAPERPQPEPSRAPPPPSQPPQVSAPRVEPRAAPQMRPAPQPQPQRAEPRGQGERSAERPGRPGDPAKKQD